MSPDEPIAPWSEELLHWATRLSRNEALAISLALLATLAFFDWISGPAYWLGPIYLFAICLPAWTLGTSAGLAMAIVCVAVASSLNNVESVPQLQPALAWNLGMRILALVFVVLLVSSFRRLHDRSWAQARFDRLTGALTKGAFDAYLAELRRRRHGGCAILAYLDLDGFKRVNDEHGHAAGDLVLRSFAEAVTARLAPGDAFARIGGDEFILMIQVRDEADAVASTRRWHDAMNDDLATLPWICSVSLGAVMFDPAEFSQALVEQADHLMYAAKRGTAPRLRIAEAEPANLDPRARHRGGRAAQAATKLVRKTADASPF